MTLSQGGTGEPCTPTSAKCITPYGVIYGRPPSHFNFDRIGRMKVTTEGLEAEREGFQPLSPKAGAISVISSRRGLRQLEADAQAEAVAAAIARRTPARQQEQLRRMNLLDPDSPLSPPVRAGSVPMRVLVSTPGAPVQAPGGFRAARALYRPSSSGSCASSSSPPSAVRRSASTGC